MQKLLTAAAALALMATAAQAECYGDHNVIDQTFGTLTSPGCCSAGLRAGASICKTWRE
jgi:hypothetical protein